MAKLELDSLYFCALENGKGKKIVKTREDQEVSSSLTESLYIKQSCSKVTELRESRQKNDTCKFIVQTLYTCIWV